MDSADALAVDRKLPLVGGIGTRPKRAAAKPESSQEDALTAVGAVCSYLDSDEDVTDFFARLSATIAQLTGANRAAFWRLGPRGTVALQVAPHGFPKDSPVYTARLQPGANGNGPVERLVFPDELELLNGTSTGLDETWHAAGLTDVMNSIAASWTAGARRIGAVVAYDSPDGFTCNDLCVLRLVGMVAGLLWQYKESEHELGYTAVRLEEAIAARRHLLNNVAAGGDEARRRFASALHDDSLQLLTGAELQLERIRVHPGTSHQAMQLDQLNHTLHTVEDSLHRLLTNVSPEPLQLPGDLNSAISERLESMRVHAGIEAHVDARVPSDLPPAIQAIAVKNIAEALTNVEKHAHATRVTIVAEGVNGGLGVEIADDGAGFVVAESARVPGHIGLVAMRERAQLAGGWCRIQSEPGAGTRIEFWVPQSLRQRQPSHRQVREMAARTTAKAAAHHLNGAKRRARAGSTELDSKSLLRLLDAVQQGDFTARMPVDGKGSAARVATALNSIIESNQRLEAETRRLNRHVGNEDDIKHGASGYAEDLLKQSLSPASELQREQHELRRYRTQLERLVGERTIALTAINRELEAFSYLVSHDLRGPLVAFDGLSKAMLEKYGGELDAAATANLEKMRDASARMTSVFDGLQMLFRLTSGEIRREELDVSSMAAKVTEDMRAADPESPTQVEVTPGIVASGDGRLVQILLGNLINNAWKFSGPNPLPRITVGRETVDGESRIFVRDNGVGFDMIDSHRLFGAFQRLHSQSEFPGAGIGLATARRIVNRHGGRIWAEGAVGEGATFYFVL